MNALEIIAELKAGRTVTIRAIDAMEFMRECERHEVTPLAIQMSFDWPQCTMRIVEN